MNAPAAHYNLAGPPWLVLARSLDGEAEIPGARHNPRILRWWQAIGQAFRDDETPWCAAFVGGVLEECGIRSSKSAAARSYLKWGRQVHPCPGAIAVFSRPPSTWSGHVGFLAGRDQLGRLMIVGGNQGNRVSVAPFDPDRLLDLRWPNDPGVVAAPSSTLPVIFAKSASSRDEA